MILYILNTLFVSSLLITCNAAYVDSINKCSIKDEKCMKDFYSGMYAIWTTTGFPEFGVETLDPHNTIEKDILPLTDDLNVIIDKGVITGLRNCDLKSYKIDVDNGVMNHEMYCDLITVDINITFSGSNALLQSFLGNSLDGSHGHGIINVGKLGINFDLGCKLVKGDDGKTYFTLPENKIEHKYDVREIKADFDRLIIGGQNMGPLITDVVNTNSKLLVDVFGSKIIDKALEYVISGLQRIFKKLPTQSFIREDLS